MSLGAQKSVGFLDLVYMCFSICMIEFQLAFVDATMSFLFFSGSVARWQWFFNMFLSPCNDVHDKIMSVGFWPCPLRRDFFWFSESFLLLLFFFFKKKDIHFQNLRCRVDNDIHFLCNFTLRNIIRTVNCWPFTNTALVITCYELSVELSTLTYVLI